VWRTDRWTRSSIAECDTNRALIQNHGVLKISKITRNATDVKLFSTVISQFFVTKQKKIAFLKSLNFSECGKNQGFNFRDGHVTTFSTNTYGWSWNFQTGNSAISYFVSLMRGKTMFPAGWALQRIPHEYPRKTWRKDGLIWIWHVFVWPVAAPALIGVQKCRTSQGV